MPTGQPDGGNSSAKVSSSQTTLVSIELTKVLSPSVLELDSAWHSPSCGAMQSHSSQGNENDLKK